MPRIIDAFSQFFDDVGLPLAGGWLKFCIAGTDTLKTTYSDSGETTPNINPLQLDASGRCPSVFGSGSYRVTSYENNGGSPGLLVQQFDPVGGDDSTWPFAAYISASIYPAGRIVTGSDGNIYISLADSNQGNDPTTDPTKWMRIDLIYFYNSTKRYAQYDVCRTADGQLFVSQVDNNQGNNPGTNSVEWHAIGIRTWNVTDEYYQNEPVYDEEGGLWVSRIADNQGNDPTADDGTRWRPAARIRTLPKTGGGTLSAGYKNELRDSNTYTLPAADSLPANSVLTVSIPDKYRSSTPTVDADGADTITDEKGADTEVLFDAGQSMDVDFITDGVSDWRI